jgi:hypothetical protein
VRERRASRRGPTDIVYNFIVDANEEGNMVHQEEPEHHIDYSVVCIATLLGLDSKLAAEDFEDILSLALVLRMTEALHGPYVRAHFREVYRIGWQNPES